MSFSTLEPYSMIPIDLSSMLWMPIRNTYSDRCAHLTKITQCTHTNIFFKDARLARMPLLLGLSLDELFGFEINPRIELKLPHN